MCILSWFLVLRVCNLYLWRNEEKHKKDYPGTIKGLDIKTWVCFSRTLTRGTSTCQ
jgi:hypothetical protein